MATAAKAHLTAAERRVLDRFLDLLRDDLGAELGAVWLYGSRARGEGEIGESDIDVLVLTKAGRADSRRVLDLLSRAESEIGAAHWVISALVQSPDWVDGRRAIDAFFIQEVDRDKIVLHGAP
ncbi:MAG: nucleotidyltransferase domain-containing protein [Thermoleophilaceae bacterium]